MNYPMVKKPHMVMVIVMLILVTLAGFVSKASSKAMERALLAAASDLMGVRSTDYRWEFLRDGMILGRIQNVDEAIYLFNLRLFGGDHRYALTLQNDGRPKAYMNIGTGPVSPHSERIALVMGTFFGDSLEDSTALDAYITHSIFDTFQNIAIHERSRKEFYNGN